MNKLQEQFISIDSAIQRAGRAGRTQNGKCYKIWHQGKILEQSDTSEILRSDLKPLILDLALWGDIDFKNYAFIDIPKDEFINQNIELLNFFNILDDKNNITKFGKIAIKLGLHPRYAFMILMANELGFAYQACIVSAILSANFSFKEDFKTMFLNIQQDYIKDYKNKEIKDSANLYLQKLKSLNILKEQKKFNINLLGVLVLFAYPDRLAKQRKKDSELYKLSNGKGAMIKKDNALFNTQYIVVTSVMLNNTNSLITSCIDINLDFIKTYFKNIIKTKQNISFDKKTNQISIEEISYIINLSLYTKKLSFNDLANKKDILLDLLQNEGLELLNFTPKVKQLQQRVNFVNFNTKDKFANLSNEYLQKNIKEWLEPYIQNISNMKDLQKLDIYDILYSLLSWQEQKELEDLAPSFIQVPSKSNIKINYEDIQKPILEVRLQEVFGLFDTPKVLNNSINLQMHLLSPASKVIAITYDLKSFWDNSYIDVRKDLRGKYKRHYWPEDPYEAIATQKTKKHMMNI
jgi:ATP-dependent helicase HrpB